ncbi:MAG: sigma-70 family RNA polymerase sigma factor [Bacillaceae bacterium]|nr:sigma-70 family RNA polymerase sigma factor [Bacillaceae bacterium]
MDNSTRDHLLLSAKAGNEIAREQLIKYYQPYVLNAAGHICKRYIHISDEEYSIGLIAFNKVIDTYDRKKGRTFLNYAFLIIQRDLIDYFRKEQKENHLSLDFKIDNDTNLQHDIEQSVEEYNKQVRSSEIIEEIVGLNYILSNFKISFEQLEKYSPKHSDTREEVMILANQFINNEDLIVTLFKKKKATG